MAANDPQPALDPHDALLKNLQRAWEVTPAYIEGVNVQSLIGQAMAALRETRAQLAQAQKDEIAYLGALASPTCPHCDLPMTCASKDAERIHGLELMHAETLTRAESAEQRYTARDLEAIMLERALDIEVTRREQAERTLAERERQAFEAGWHMANHRSGPVDEAYAAYLASRQP